MCDGEITPDQAARLEQIAGRSDEARRYFLHYLQLDGELYWDAAAAADRQKSAAIGPLLDAPFAGTEWSPAAETRTPIAPPRKMALLLTAVAAAALVMVVGWWTRPGARDEARPGRQPTVVARLTATVDADWSDADAPPTAGAGLAPGRKLQLDRGLAEIAFDSGARVILQGPAQFEVSSRGRGFLHAGCLTANVPPDAVGFSIRTPTATVVDMGTDFGLVVDPDGPSEIHVFRGAVEVQPGTAVGDHSNRRAVRAGQAVSVSSSGAQTPAIQEIAFGSRRFARALPPSESPAGSVARLRDLVGRNPHLLHHYTFEGDTPEKKRQDKRDGLRLSEVVMADGRGQGYADYFAPGINPTSEAVRPFRAAEQGDANGVALQSEDEFPPPNKMTVELMLNFDGFEAYGERLISAAVATRENDRNCGFLIAVIEEGRLAHLMDREAPWTVAELAFIPGEWYYVASTFSVVPGNTTINSYVANLSRGEQTLTWVVRNEVAPGEPAPSRLGVGKAFADNIAHAYPWAGALDEVAIYDAVLDRQTLQTHLQALVGPP